MLRKKQQKPRMKPQHWKAKQQRARMLLQGQKGKEQRPNIKLQVRKRETAEALNEATRLDREAVEA